MARTSKKAKEPTEIDVLMTGSSDSNTKAPKKTITINLETETIDYFKAAANSFFFLKTRNLLVI